MGDWNLEIVFDGECEAGSAIVARAEGRCGWSGACTCQGKRVSENSDRRH